MRVLAFLARIAGCTRVIVGVSAAKPWTLLLCHSTRWRDQVIVVRVVAFDIVLRLLVTSAANARRRCACRGRVSVIGGAVPISAAVAVLVPMASGALARRALTGRLAVSVAVAVIFVAIVAWLARNRLGVLRVGLAIGMPIRIAMPALGQSVYRSSSEEQTGYGQCSDPDQSSTSISRHS